MTARKDIVEFLDERLDIGSFSDRSNNGLQVEGAHRVPKIAVATDAAMATYKKTIEAGCQMLVTHHGLIWGGIDYITGRNYQQISFLIKNDLNLYAAHLPLDAHPEVGNNAVLTNQAKLTEVTPFGEYHGVKLGYSGVLPHKMTNRQLASIWKPLISGEPRILDFGPTQNRKIGIVSGGGASCMGEAIANGFDCLVTGEGDHPNYHEAKEGKINVVYLGHYASETVGVKAVASELEGRFKVETVFIDEPTGF